MRISTSLGTIALVAATIATALAAPAPQPEAAMPAPTASTDPAMLARAKKVFAQVQSGKIDRSELAPSANGSLTDDRLASAKAMVGNLGAPVSFVQKTAGAQGDVNFAIYLLAFKNGKKLDFLFAVDKQGKIAGLRLGTPNR